MSATAHATELPVTPHRMGAVAAVAAVGVSLPATVLPNAVIAARLGVSEDWIERRTGIRTRYIAAPGERLTDHAALAAERALARARVPAASVDLVLVATTTADELLPNAAPLVAHAIGAHRAGAFDVGGACTGFLCALAVGAAHIEAGRVGTVLVIGADFMSRITDPGDRATAAVFADGAGAVVMVASDKPGGVGPVLLGIDGAAAKHIVADGSPAVVRMQGPETYRAAVTGLTHATRAAAGAAGVELDEIDLFVYHQANGRILGAVAARLALPPDRVIDCIADYGNTSAATMPLALAHSEGQDRLHPGQRVLLGACGAGFTWAASVLEWGAG